MKKIILILIAGLAILLMIMGIAVLKNKNGNKTLDSDIASVESNLPENYKKEFDGQLKTIAENFDIWSKVEDYLDDSIKYTITDLDHNNRLEIIVTQIGENAGFSLNHYYELNSNLSSIESCKANVEKNSQVDLSLMKKVDTYYDSSNDVYYYMVKDTMQSVSNEEYEATYTLSLKSGVVEQELLASKLTILPEGKNSDAITSYMDKDGQTITRNQYDSYIKDFYKGFAESKTVLKLKWKDLSDLKDLSKEEIINELKNSLSL